MGISCFNPFRFKKKEKPISYPSSSSKSPWKTEMENMERKRFDSLESWSMILDSENVETWEVAKEDQEEWTADLSQLFIGNKFASGAHSRIYRGIYKQRAVAVKMVRIPTHKEETRIMLEQQFKSEVSLLSRLYHPNIVQFIAACKKPPVYCIIMEYMSQGTLRMYLNKKEPYSLSTETVLRLALDISRGMEYLHSQGVVHRDLKSNNLLLNDESDLTVIITGGASGIGLETTRVLAMRGAHVIIAARNMKAANEAKQLVVKHNEKAKIDVLELDLSSLKSIKTFSHSFKALNLPLNILINNAGIMFCPYQLSQDGIEMQFATNHLGHFYLTNLLLDKMKETAAATGIEGRIVNLSSVAHVYTYEKGIRFDKISDKDSYSDKRAYGQSKLANILHANELSRRLKEEGANITVNSVHPGIIMTDLMRHSFWQMRILKLFTYLFWKNVPQGAATSCYVAVHPGLKGVSGKYFLDCNEWPASKFATDPELAKNLWDYSNNLVNSLQH